MSPLVSTLRAQAAAKPQAVAREGCGCRSDIQNSSMADAKPQADDHIGNDDARVDENAEGSQQDQRGIEAGRVGGEQAAASHVDNQKQGERSDSQRQASGPILGPKESEARRHAPVHERSFFQVADAIRVEGNPVMARDHFPRNFGMHRVGIIQQRRTEERESLRRAGARGRQA